MYIACKMYYEYVYLSTAVTKVCNKIIFRYFAPVTDADNINLQECINLTVLVTKIQKRNIAYTAAKLLFLQ